MNIQEMMLISYVTNMCGRALAQHELQDFTFFVKQTHESDNRCEAIDELLKQMALGQKIPAIKAYRALTNIGLKEAKDAVEKYWKDAPVTEGIDR